MKSKKEQKQRRDRQARRAAKKKCLGDQKMRFCPTLRQRGWILSSAEDEAMARGKEKPRHAKCLGWLVMGPFTRRAQGNLEDETSSSRLTAHPPVSAPLEKLSFDQSKRFPKKMWRSSRPPSNTLRMARNTTKLLGLKQIEAARCSIAEVPAETGNSDHVLRRAGLTPAIPGNRHYPIPGTSGVEAPTSPSRHSFLKGPP
jgi:hypothetical protein